MSKRKMNLNDLETIKKRVNGVFGDKEKMALDDLEGVVVTIDEYEKMGNGNSAYYAVSFREYPSKYVLSCKSLTDLLDTEDIDMTGLQIKVNAKQRLKNGRDFRSIEVVGYEE